MLLTSLLLSWLGLSKVSISARESPSLDRRKIQPTWPTPSLRVCRSKDLWSLWSPSIGQFGRSRYSHDIQRVNAATGSINIHDSSWHLSRSSAGLLTEKLHGAASIQIDFWLSWHLLRIINKACGSVLYQFCTYLVELFNITSKIMMANTCGLAQCWLSTLDHHVSSKSLLRQAQLTCNCEYASIVTMYYL